MLIAALIVWIAGAAYCHGYEKLLTGVDRWPGSLIWSATAVLPWLVLAEWSKSSRGRLLTASWPILILALVFTAAVSMLLEGIANGLAGAQMPPLGLDMMRRLPAIGASLLIILWVHALRDRESAEDEPTAIADIGTLAGSIDWVAAADNYVELHIGEHIVLRRMTIQTAESQLSSFGFVRIHRRYLVNRARLCAVAGRSGKKSVTLASGIELPIGRRFGSNLDA